MSGKILSHKFLEIQLAKINFTLSIEFKMQYRTMSFLFRFKDKKDLPENIDELKKLHEDIQIVRVPRQAKKKLSFAFFEFGSEAKADEAKVSFSNLTTNSSVHRF